MLKTLRASRSCVALVKDRAMRCEDIAPEKANNKYKTWRFI